MNHKATSLHRSIDMSQAEKHTSKNYLSLKQWLNKYQAIPEGGIRHLIFTNKDNFTAKVVKKIGRKILLDEEAFLNYIDAHSKE